MYLGELLMTKNISYLYFSATDMVSSVTSPDQPGLTYTLTLLRSEPTFAQPEQLWQFVSDHAVSLFVCLFVCVYIVSYQDLSKGFWQQLIITKQVNAPWPDQLPFFKISCILKHLHFRKLHFKDYNDMQIYFWGALLSILLIIRRKWYTSHLKNITI